MKVSRYLVESLLLSGVDVAFGLPGVHILGMWEALEASGMRYVGFRHEQAAAHAADCFGRATGKPGVVLLSTGPGSLNATSALAEATVSSSPVLAIVSNIPSNLVGKEKGYLHETQDLGPAFQAVSRGHFRAGAPEEVPTLLGAAMEAAWATRPGAAVLDLPTDFFDAEIEASPEALTFQPKAPPDGAIEEAASLLELAARPLIWAGGGVLRSGASAELVALAEALDAPVLTTFMGKGALSEGHTLSVGTFIRFPSAPDLLEQSDLMLAVGTRFSSMSTAGWKLPVPSQLIHVDIDPEELGRNYPVRLGIESDAATALRSLREALGPARVNREISGSERAGAIRQAAFETGRAEGPREMAFLDAVRQAINPETPVIHDMCVASYWAWPFLPAIRPGTSHCPYGYGGLGFAFPAAIGAAAADPSAPVVVFTGDGGFQYHHRELATASEFRLPVKVLVFNDSAWGILRSFAQIRYGTTFGMDLPGPDFMELARSYDVPATRAETPEDLEKALREAVGRPGPELIEVPGAWAPPPPSEYYRR